MKSGGPPFPYRRSLVTATLAITALIQSCTDESSHSPQADPADVRAIQQHKMAVNSRPDNKQTWDIVASGSYHPNNTIQLFYQRDTIDIEHRASGNQQHHPDYWNREHVWPQSYGLKGTSAAADLHNIVPVDRTINTSRGNKIFDDATQPHAECTHCKSSTTAWEPADASKGDVARIVFYMDVRYDGSDDVPDLRLADTPDKDQAIFGRLSTLLRWHCSDPVSGEERRRHDVVAKAQGNRNVFVDTPNLVEIIYGYECANEGVELSDES